MRSIIFTALLAIAAPVAFAQSPAAASAGSVTATCKDGTQYKGASLSGACAGHHGIDKKAGAATAKVSDAAPNEATKAATKADPVAGTAAAASAGKVWANASSKVYHCSGDKYFGKTKRGEYMTESDAKAKGYHASHGKVCS